MSGIKCVLIFNIHEGHVFSVINLLSYLGSHFQYGSPCCGAGVVTIWLNRFVASSRGQCDCAVAIGIMHDINSEIYRKPKRLRIVLMRVPGSQITVDPIVAGAESTAFSTPGEKHSLPRRFC